MKWSWKIGEFAGIGVYVHATFVLIIGWVVLIHWTQGQSLNATVIGVLFVLAIFACVVLHEFGHALQAKKYGITTRDITLLPIGGLARLEKMPDDPRQEFWVALAGPFVNVVIAALLYGWIAGVEGRVISLDETGLMAIPFLDRLMLVNVFLVVFNMLPAFPMDGGRVLRAALAMRMDPVEATQIAASLGQGMAFLFGFVGLLTNPFLLFIALFVWMGAEQEASLVRMRSAFSGIPVRYSMVTGFRALSPNDPLSRAVEEILAGFQQDFPVLEDGEVVGILTRSDLMMALAQRQLQSPVSTVMQSEFQTVDEDEMLEQAFQKLQNCDCKTMPVMRKNQLVGLLTMDNIGEFLSIRSALKESSGWKRRFLGM